MEHRLSAVQNNAGKQPQIWIGLSNKGLLRPQTLAGNQLDQGCFVIEFRLPLPKEKVLLEYQCQSGFPNSFALFFDPDVGLAIIHRSRSRVARHTIDGPLPVGVGTARVTFKFDIDAQTWAMTYEILTLESSFRSAQGSHALPIGFADLDQICTASKHSDAVLWFGFCHGNELPKSAPWVGPRTMIATSLGWVAAGNLRAGDIIMTEDHGPLPLMSARRVDLPARGSFAPSLLRAPFFGTGQDLLVSAEQKLLMNSGEVEYLFGCDGVLVSAKEVVDGRTALADDRRTLASVIRLDLGRSALIDVGGLLLAVNSGHEAADAFATLSRFEAATLMAMLRRQVTRVA